MGFAYLIEKLEDVVYEDVGDDYFGGDNEAEAHRLQVPRVSPQEREGVEVDRSLDGEVLEGAEVVAAVVEGGLAAEDLVPDEKAEGLELGAVLADVDDLAPVPLVLVHLEGENLQSRTDGGEQRLHVGELHRHEVELDEMLQ